MLSRQDKELKKQIVKAVNNVRKKYKSIKYDRQHEMEDYEKIFKPVTEKLNDVIAINEVKKEPVKTEPVSVKIVPVNTASPEKMMMKGDTVPSKSPKKSPQFIPIRTIAEHEPNLSFEEESEEEQRRHSLNSIRDEFSQHSDPRILEDYLNQYPEIARSYVKGYIFDQNGDYDTTYGINFTPELSRWSMGKAKVDFDKHGNILIDSTPFTGTEGLYELLFKAKPKDSVISQDDKARYAEILNMTSAHKRNFDPNQQVKGSSSYKYLNFVKKQGTPKNRPNRSGKGLLSDNSVVYNEKPIEFVYYNDPNELVSRLRVLVSSTVAGNNSHHNEIASIIEELKEAGIIV